jgi:hypothetical protein
MDHTVNTASSTTSIIERGPLPSNNSTIVAYLGSYCLAVTIVSLFISESLLSNESVCHNIDTR